MAGEDDPVPESNISENEPVTDDETVIRRILEDYYDETLEYPIQPTAFRPTKNDIEGISVFREYFSKAEDVIASGNNPSGKGYHAARLEVSEIITSGMTVKEDPQDDQLQGHALIPEINYPSYKDRTTKKKIKELRIALAILASKNVILSS